MVLEGHRLDGQVFGFTSVDQDLEIDGVTYVASTGITPYAIDSKADLSVPNMQVNGLLDSTGITEADLVAGLWDGAAVENFEVNFRDLSQGKMNSPPACWVLSAPAALPSRPNCGA
jgi:uncharacterized phage protein (TIGR02218 family)